MKDFAKRHPLVFGALLFLVTTFAVVPLMLVSEAIGLGREAGSAVGRIVVGLVLAVLFRECFMWERSLSGLGLALPALVIVAWNVIYHLLSGSQLVAPGALAGAVLLGLAPGVFEEVIFRGIVIGKLREGGRGDWQVLLASSLLFAAVHLTNAAGMDLASLLVQVGYSFVVGLLLGAIYLRSGDIVTVVLAHALIDVSNQVFATSPTSSSIPMVVGFVVVLVIEVACALSIMRGRPQEGSAGARHDA